MSSAETGLAHVSRRSLVRGLSLLLVTAPVLASCGEAGLHPLYGVGPSGVGVEERLAKVEFAPIPGRVGQRIRNELIFQANGAGAGPPPTHRLEVVVNESVSSQLVALTGEAASQTYLVQANFRLVNLKDGKVVFQGTSSARAGFERYTSVYSIVRAQEDAENRAARTIADELKTRLAAYLSRPA
jgi:LPS-assembly lipoprotein